MFSVGGMLLLAGAMVFMTTGTAQAQRGGHGDVHGGGFHAGGYHGALISGYRGGYYHGGYHNWGYRPYYGYRPYWGGYYPYYGYYPYSGFYPYYNAYGYNPYLYGGDASLVDTYADNTVRFSDGITYDSGYRGLSPREYETYAQAAPATSRTLATLVDNTAHITATVPADAEIWINGVETQTTRTVRQFQSPPLTPGNRYGYEIRARWSENGREVTQTQKIAVTAGSQTRVTFPTTAQTAAK
jgi:uncharacterized protein (TIGR03000 family)